VLGISFLHQVHRIILEAWMSIHPGVEMRRMVTSEAEHERASHGCRVLSATCGVNSIGRLRTPSSLYSGRLRVEGRMAGYVVAGVVTALSHWVGKPA